MTAKKLNDFIFDICLHNQFKKTGNQSIVLNEFIKYQVNSTSNLSTVITS